MARKAAVRRWDSHDSALWYTCEIAFDLAAGRAPTRALDVLAPFPLSFAPDERLWASGHVDLFEWRALEEGTYLQDGGVLYISARGFSLHTHHGVLPWDWASLTATRVVGPRAVQISGQGSGGPVTWVLRSDWAELVFVTWAFAVHRRHPQLLDGSWLPTGWLEWASSQRYASRLPNPALASGPSGG